MVLCNTLNSMNEKLNEPSESLQTKYKRGYRETCGIQYDILKQQQEESGLDFEVMQWVEALN